MQTRRYPRTLQEAFGPYTSRDLEPPHEPLSLRAMIAIPTLTAVASWLFMCLF